jgi:peptidyl-dipeptidase A
MLKLGRSKPWREAMETMTGQREFSADAIMDYFEPLMKWLRKYNADKRVGWET